MMQPAKDNLGRLTYLLATGMLALGLATMALTGPSVMAKSQSSWKDLAHLMPEVSTVEEDCEIALPDDSIPSIVPVSMEEGWVSSEFGVRERHPVTGKKNVLHQGIDLAVWIGTPVKATAEGIVTFAGRKGGYGKLVVIDHFNGIKTFYAHNSQIKAKKGQYVTRGTVIALSGNTGTSTGAHLHYEVRVNGKAINPRYYLPELPDK